MAGGTRRLVLLGHPIAHSLSPVFQNAAIRAAGLDATYDALDVAPENLLEVIDALRESGDAGGNVTVPHKARFAASCDERTPLAEHVGAVNTFWMRDGRLMGDNTDVGGFDHAARAVLGREARDLVVGVVGAGGASAAVLAATELWPGAVTLLWNRTPERARTLAMRFRGVECVADVSDVAGRADLVVNATTLGMRDDDPLPVDPTALSASAVILDLVYRQGDTPLVRQARARGLAAAGGLTMLLEQGALAFERWFGVAPDRGCMAEAVASLARQTG
jgi:shikimate dehydrogenase